MIHISTPLRICLLGGSTDNPHFISKYNKSHIISFTSNYKTHVSLSKPDYDLVKNYYINGFTSQKTKHRENIKNDLVFMVFEHFNIPPVYLSMTSDIQSNGCGLASSSSFLISLIQACCKFTQTTMSQYEIGKLALQLERKINPYTGYQDPFGCLFEGFKSLYSKDDEIYDIQYVANELRQYYNFDLIPTGINRFSMKILEDISKNVDKILPLYDLSLHGLELLRRQEYKQFIQCINENWKIKKSTSKLITQNKKVRDLDEFCEKRDEILAHKLLGAGNGGFFLVVTRKNEPLTSNIFNVILRNA